MPFVHPPADFGRGWRNLAIAIGLVIVVGPAGAQEKPTNGVSVKVFTVQRGDAFARAQMLQSLLGQGQSVTRPLRMAADRRTNTIIAVGSPIDLELIRGLLARLDEPVTTQRFVRQARVRDP